MTNKPIYDVERLKHGLLTIEANIDRINVALESLREQRVRVQEDDIQVARVDSRIQEMKDAIKDEEDQKVEFKCLIRELEITEV